MSLEGVEIHFYHLERARFEEIAPVLLDKTRLMGWRALVQVSSLERATWLSNLLWTFREGTFLAHGCEGEDYCEDQPIWITSKGDHPNFAQLQMIANPVPIRVFPGIRRVCYLFDGRDLEALDAARSQWRNLKSSGASPVYWKQGEQGQWQKGS